MATAVAPLSRPHMAGSEPFSHETESAVGVLVSHGFTGCPGSMRALAEAFAKAGWNVECPCLTGHGSQWQDLIGVPAEQWLADLDAALDRLRARSSKLFVVGLSMGGTLALRLAQTQPNIMGVMVINHALVFGNPLVGLARVLKHGVRSIPAIASDIKDPDQVEPAYSRTPLAGVAEVYRLARMVERDLPSLMQPLLVFKSTQDHVLPARNAKLLMDRAGSVHKELVWLENSYHVATLDYDRELIQSRCLEFVERLGGDR